MKATDSASRASRIECWPAANQPAGWSTADRPPAASMRTGCAASAPAVAAATAASNATYSAARPAGPAPEPGRQPAVGKEQDDHHEQYEARGPQLVEHQCGRAERQPVPEAVDVIRVVSGVVTDEQELPVNRKSQPSGLPGWRRATTTPTAVHGMPITTATIPSPSWPESSDSGSVASRHASARSASGTRGRRPRVPARRLAGRVPVMIYTLRRYRSENVTALAWRDTWTVRDQDLWFSRAEPW